MSVLSGSARAARSSERPVAAGEQVSAARGGAQVFAAAVVALVSNYLFILGAGRILGSADYGTVAALSGLITVVLLPTGAIQMAASREISRREALGEHVEAAAFVRALVVLGAKATVPLLALALVLLVPLREILQIDATTPVALALSALVGVFLFPVALGALQGEQRFRALAFNSAAPMVLKLVLFVAFVAAGSRLYGALGAIAVSTAAGTTVALLTNRRLLAAARGVEVPDLRPFLRYLVPVAVGLFGIAVLTNADILVVKARFSADDAGVYAAASAFARVLFFLPATLLAVVFPRTAARQARGEESSDILGRSLIVTAGFCALLTAMYAVIGTPLVDLTFGDDYADAAGLLVPFCVAMTCFSLANVALGYHLSRNESRFAWIVAGSTVLQMVVLSTVPDTLRGVLWANAVIGVALLAAHEITVGNSANALRTGFGMFRLGGRMRSSLAFVTARWSIVVETLVVIAGYALLAAAVTWPLALHLGDALPGTFPNDGTGGAGWLWQLQQEGGFKLLGTTHHTLTGAPFGWDQGNALNFQWLLPYYPGYVLATLFGAVVAINLVTLGGLALSGATMYLLVRWLGCPRLVAGWAGLVYLAFPWHLERVMAGHSSLVHLEMFPLFVLAALAWVRRPSDGRALLVALAMTGAWLTSGYYGAMTFVALGGISVVAVVLFRGSLGWVGGIAKTAKLWAMAILATGLVGLTSALAGGTAAIGTGRAAGELAYYGARLHDYLPDPGNPLVGGLSTGIGKPLYPYTPGAENVLYPGLLTIGLGLLWLAVVFLGRATASRLRVSTYVLLSTVVTGLVFATPDPIRIFGFSLHPTPSYLLYSVLPRFRVPSRLVVITMVGLVALAALGLAWLCARLARGAAPRRALLASTAVPLAACAISFAELPPLPVVTSDVANEPSEYRAVGARPPGILAEYPLTPTWGAVNSAYVFWQQRHGRRLLNGAAEGTQADAIRQTLVDPGAPGTAAALRLLGVNTLVTRSNTLDWLGRGRLGDRASYGPGFELVARGDDGARVWAVVAPSAPAVAAYRLTDVAAVGRARPDGFVPFSLEGKRVRLDLFARSESVAELNLGTRIGARGGTVRVRGVGPEAVIGVGAHGVVSVPVAVPRGHSVLTLTIEPSLTGESKGRGPALSAPWWSPARAADDRMALRPRPVSNDPGF